MKSSHADKSKGRRKALQYLRGNRLMALGTSWRDKPWGATVFFAFDNKMNTLFYSRPDTRHCRNVTKNPLVSVVINQDWGTPGFVKGLQMLGRAVRVSKKDYVRYYSLYRARYKWADEFAKDHVLYIIKPIEAHYIDHKFFGHFFRVRVI